MGGTGYESRQGLWNDMGWEGSSLFPECVVQSYCFQVGVWGVDRARSAFWRVLAHVRERPRMLASAVPLGFAASVSLGMSCRGFTWQAWDSGCMLALKDLLDSGSPWISPCVMSRHATSCPVISSRVLSCRILSCHLTPCCVMSCHVLSRDRSLQVRLIFWCVIFSWITSCCLFFCYGVPCPVLRCPFIPVVLCLVISSRIMSCRVM